MTNPAAQHELSITRLIDAPPETVYHVWTTRTGEWWAPKPYTTPGIELDLRPGGLGRMDMRSPDGEDMPNQGVFLEVVPNRKLVFSNVFKAGWVPQALSNEGCDFAMVAIITFEPEGSGTRYTAQVRHWNEEARKRHEEMGFHEGWGIVAGQLAALAEAEAHQSAAA
jgi:uncharacterized protein YndB with AHSA1/START domain